jgi:hypothetical protein
LFALAALTTLQRTILKVQGNISVIEIVYFLRQLVMLKAYLDLGYAEKQGLI